ncbi:MAG TPA: glycerol-3-phosphate acyltransferase [Ktedonobacterales bacterium]|jgi:glycerol-3-phosphate acyltransferase PlsY|nr:glycerol-3-phosphate acyltransferase [Ktedonobacterales bacterium]
MTILWLALCYGSGALPWSVWLGKLVFHRDPREQPDRNPGAANAFRAAGWRLGVIVLLLDFLKAFIPVAVARWLLGIPSPLLFWLAFMPTLGHAFSVFLRFRGGRGIVVMFGVWAALTLYHIPLVMGLTAIGAVFLFKNDEYRTLAIPTVLLAYLLLTHAPSWMAWLAVAQLVVLLVKIGAFVVQRHARTRIETS